MLYMVTWIPSIYPSYVSIYTSTMDPMGFEKPWIFDQRLQRRQKCGSPEVASDGHCHQPGRAVGSRNFPKTPPVFSAQNSYGHLLVITGYKWDYKYLQLVKGHN